jgi:D-arabinose 1-dehydrogenase-like Zn-dependent alcohol dehydrogenase
MLASCVVCPCRNLTVSGSVIGNLAMTQEMLDFCGQHNITADVEVSRTCSKTELFCCLV